MYKNCKICGISFKSVRSTNTLCKNPICKKINKNQITTKHNSKRVLKRRIFINCKVCNKPFETTEKYHKITCSKECRKINKNRLIPSRLTRIKRKINKKCKICEKDYVATENGLSKTCSKECRMINIKRVNLIHTRKRGGVTIKTKKCIICHNNFITARKDGQIITCSKKCQKTYHKQWNQKYHGIIFTNKKCNICKKEYTTTEKSQKKTCSKKCSIEFQRRNDKRNAIEYRKNHPEKFLEYNRQSLCRLGVPFKLPSWRYQYTLYAWSKSVKKTNGNYCAVCRSTYKLNSHHIFYKKDFPELSLNVNNGIPLCIIHHSEVHRLN